MEEACNSFEVPTKYIVLISAVRLLEIYTTKSIDKAKKVLDSPIFREESFGNIKLYTQLIQAIIDKNAQEFINELLQDSEFENMYYDDNMVAYSKEIINCQDNMQNLLITIEEQLLGMAYAESGGDCKNHKQQARDYLQKNKILDKIRVYKDESGVINKSMLFLDVTMIRFGQSTDEMDRFSFRL